MKKVICIGSATKDVFLDLEDSKIIENKGDLFAKKLFTFEFGAKIYAKKLREELGGSAVNVATGLVGCEIRPFVMSRASKSDIGKWIVKKIGKRKLKKNYFQQTLGTESQVSVVISDKKHKDHVIFRTGDSVENFDITKALNKFREKVDWIYIGSQKAGWEEKFKEIVEFSKTKKANIAMNPSSYQISENAKELWNKLEDLDILFMNRDEALELVRNATGEVKDEIPYLFEKIFGFASKLICIITDGSDGAYVSKKDANMFFLPTQATSVEDTVGAGDAFSSGFLASYIEFNDIKRALCWGMANSANVIKKEGSVNGLLKKKDLKRIGDKLVSKVSVIR